MSIYVNKRRGTTTQVLATAADMTALRCLHTSITWVRMHNSSKYMLG